MIDRNDIALDFRPEGMILHLGTHPEVLIPEALVRVMVQDMEEWLASLAVADASVIRVKHAGGRSWSFPVTWGMFDSYDLDDPEEREELVFEDDALSSARPGWCTYDNRRDITITLETGA